MSDMKMSTGTAKKRPALIRAAGAPRVRKPADSHWFDHPEMQARIARAEADFREGRFQSGTSVEELLSQLDALKK